MGKCSFQTYSTEFKFEALECDEDEGYMHLAEIYSIGCHRLVGLMRVGLGDADRLTVFLREQMERAIREVGKEWKIAEGWERR